MDKGELVEVVFADVAGVEAGEEAESGCGARSGCGTDGRSGAEGLHGTEAGEVDGGEPDLVDARG